MSDLLANLKAQEQCAFSRADVLRGEWRNASTWHSDAEAEAAWVAFAAADAVAQAAQRAYLNAKLAAKNDK